MAEQKKLDLTTLAPEPAELPKRAGSKDVRDNPFVPWLTESYEAQEGRQVTVPKGAEQDAVYLIRRAADKLGLGARVVLDPNPGTKSRPSSEEEQARYAKARQVKVLFQAKDRKEKKDAAAS